MKKVLNITILLMLFALTASSQSIYKIDRQHSSVNFKVKHFSISFVNGRFEQFDGGIIGSIDDPQSARVFFNIKTNSIYTGVEQRDNHLISDEFFDTKRFPIMSFESNSIEKIDDENYKLTGKLQIKDVTKDATFNVQYGGTAENKNGEQVVGFVAKSTINRFDYKVAGDPDGLAIAKDVEIILYLEFKKS
ncbi:MAG: YceI family protein [Fermentimonas sp.]|jgi:polyisoprenoid-binding protein YceI